MNLSIQMKNFKYLIFILITTFFWQHAKADYLDLHGTSSSTGVNLGWNNLTGTYRVHWREVPDGDWTKRNSVTVSDPLVTVGAGGLVYEISGLFCNTEYEFKVKQKGRGWRRLNLTTKACKIEIPDDAVRIKNMSFGKCVYPYNPGTGVRFHNYGCWDDPAFAFIVQPTGTINEVKLRSLAAGSQCLMPVDDSPYGEITTGSCSSVYAVYQIQDIDGTQFRLKNKVRNKCLYGSPDNGGLIRDFGCWANPDMNFIFEGY